MKRKLMAGALALVMLAGCTAPVPDTQKLPDDGGEETRVAYVPLDDRPVNTDRVEYLAGSLGYELVMPDAEAYRTRLDEQPLGESGLKYGRGAVLSGADEDGMLAVCKMYAELDCSGALPELRVRYFGGSENSAMSAYDHQTAAEVVAAHLDYLGLDSTNSDTADRLELIVLTMPADESKKSRYISDAIAALNENRKNGVATVLMDASRNKYGADFQARLVKSTELGFLMGYAGYYDLANASGIALANGVARWLCLAQGGPETQAQLDDFRRTLADSLIKDICYKNDVKIELDAYIRGELGGDPDNFCRSGADPDVVLTKARQLLDESAAPVLDNLAHSSYLTDLDGGTAGFGSLSVKDLSFPWLRIFELHIFLEAN